MSAKRAESDLSDYSAIWHSAREILRNTVAAVHFDNHITNLEFKAVSGVKWTLATPSPTSLEWLQTRLSGDVVRALERASGTPVTVAFVVAESELDEGEGKTERKLKRVVIKQGHKFLFDNNAF